MLIYSLSSVLLLIACSNTKNWGTTNDISSMIETNELVPIHEYDCYNIDHSLASQIKIDYCKYINLTRYQGQIVYTADKIAITYYGGHFGECDFVYISDGTDHDFAMRYENIAGYDFPFTSSQILYAYNKGNFYTVKEAYDSNLISKTDVYNLGCSMSTMFKKQYPNPQ